MEAIVIRKHNVTNRKLKICHTFRNTKHDKSYRGCLSADTHLLRTLALFAHALSMVIAPVITIAVLIIYNSIQGNIHCH